MSTPTAKRSLFQTPVRSRKRQRTMGKKQRTTMKIPKSLLPETKMYSRVNLSNIALNAAFSSIPQDLTQGDNSDNFVGSKFRIQRIRVWYDFSQISLSSGLRVVAVIPKDPSAAPVSVVTTSTTPINTREFTVLHDMLLPDSVDTASGTFDITGPINVEMNNTGTSVFKNNLWLFVWAATTNTQLQDSFSYQVWYTDA